MLGSQEWIVRKKMTMKTAMMVMMIKNHHLHPHNRLADIADDENSHCRHDMDDQELQDSSEDPQEEPNQTKLDAEQPKGGEHVNGLIDKNPCNASEPEEG